MCGFVGRARLNINLPRFRKADSETRRRIVREIMDHFNVPEQWRMQVEHAALKKARDAWRNWKHVLYKKYLSEGKDLIPVYPQITKADWEEFKRVRATKEFAEKSGRAHHAVEPRVGVLRVGAGLLDEHQVGGVHQDGQHARHVPDGVAGQVAGSWSAERTAEPGQEGNREDTGLARGVFTGATRGVGEFPGFASQLCAWG